MVIDVYGACRRCGAHLYQENGEPAKCDACLAKEAVDDAGYGIQTFINRDGTSETVKRERPKKSR